jgi:chaperonin subunit
MSTMLSLHLQAMVITVGPGTLNKEGCVVPMSVKAGDRVLLLGWGGSAIKVGEEVCWSYIFGFFPECGCLFFVGALSLYRY